MKTTSPPPLPTTTNTATSINDHRPRCFPRRPSASSAATSLLILLLSISAWLSLVFSPVPTPTTAPARTNTTVAFSDTALSSDPLSLSHIVFGVAGSAHLFPRRRHFIGVWWRPSTMRGHLWLDDALLSQHSLDSLPHLPPIRVSEDISRFRYTNPIGHPSGLRIARIAAESFRLGHPGARWFFLCDDDTIVSPDNLVDVLAKYDWTEMVYIGGPSETHSANTHFSHSMAFGGGGIAISYPLAEALAGMEDECLERYPKLYGSDDRLHACISELGVPLTRELGFHQWDIRGDGHGLLAAHPVAPFVSIHHLESVDPLYPGLSSLESIQLFAKAMTTDPRSFLQRAICYHRKQKLTFLVSLGYVVQVFPSIVLPRELERSERTYLAWNWLSSRDEFGFDTRDVPRSVCKKPILFFLKDTWKDENVTMGSYIRVRREDDLKRKVFCFPRSIPLHDVNEIRVLGDAVSKNWVSVPRRLCCKINQTNNGLLGLIVSQCERGSFGSVTGLL